MARGETFAAEWRIRTDHETGVEVRQLTDHKGHSHHLYFTNPGWYDDGRKLLFGSDRGNRTNLFGLDLGSGEITQLTDLDLPPPPGETSFLFTSKNPVKEEAYFWHGRDLVALDLSTLDTRVLYEAPEGFLPNITNVTADGRHVCSVIYQDLSKEFGVDLLRGYVGFAEYWAARPLSRVVLVDTSTGQDRVAFEEKYWIGHTNTSPTRSNLATYCHEGPWYDVDNRIWGLDLDTGHTWKIRPTGEGERVGHEHWLADGIHIGYHGTHADGSSFFGRIHYDGTDSKEVAFPHHSTHFHTNDLEVVVGDGSRDNPRLLLWRRQPDDAAEGFDGPRVLLNHRGSFHIQAVHVHPRLRADNAQVLFTSDASGYGNLHLVDVPDLDDLPLATA